MSTPTPPPLGDLFNDRRRRPTVFVDQVDKGKVLVTAERSKDHPDGWSGYASRQGSRWRVENESDEHIGNAKNAAHVGHVLAKHYGHEPDSYDVKYTKDAY